MLRNAPEIDEILLHKSDDTVISITNPYIREYPDEGGFIVSGTVQTKKASQVIEEDHEIKYSMLTRVASTWSDIEYIYQDNEL